MDFESVKEFLLFLLIFPMAGLFLLVVLSLTYLGWKLSGKIKNSHLRIIVRAAGIAIAFSPALTPHPVPAHWLLFFSSDRDWITSGLVPILLVFILGVSVGYGVRWKRRKRVP